MKSGVVPNDVIQLFTSKILGESDGVVASGENPNKLPLQKNLFAQEIHYLTGLLNQFEQAKYPSSRYQYVKGNVTLNNIPMDFVYVNYDGQALTEKDHQDIADATIKVRKLSLIAGVVNALGFSEKYLNFYNDKQKEAIVGKLLELAQRVSKSSIHEKKPIDEMGDFVNEMMSEIVKITQNNGEFLLRHIRNAERYFVAEYNRNRMLIFETPTSQGKIFQVDVPKSNQLTKKQKEQYTSINAKQPSDRPIWFSQLEEYEQDWFRQTLDIDQGVYFESLFKSSAMQHVPGICNARHHYLIKVKEKDNQTNINVLSKNLKLATLVPYEMSSEEEIKKSTSENAEQALEILIKDANANLNALKSMFPRLPETYKPTILVQSLLSDTFGEKSFQYIAGNMDRSDNTLTKIQSTAIENYTSKYFEIRSGNDPVNAFRKLKLNTSDRWKNVDAVLNETKVFKPLVARNPQEAKRLSLIKNARHNLKGLRKATVFIDSNGGMNFQAFKGLMQNKGINYEAYKTAYLSILVEMTGGAVSTNCKSGKDRTGLEELYRNAMLEYYDQYGSLPAYNDNNKNSENFINIFIKLYNSKKAHEAAAGNTPGSFGLKDDAGMLCPRIVKAMRRSYEESNKLSAMNKPVSFQKDESAQAKETLKPIKTTEYEKLEIALIEKAKNCYANVDNVIDDKDIAYKVKNKIAKIVDHGLIQTKSDDDNEVRLMKANNVLNRISDATSIESMINGSKPKHELSKSKHGIFNISNISNISKKDTNDKCDEHLSDIHKELTNNYKFEKPKVSTEVEKVSHPIIKSEVKVDSLTQLTSEEVLSNLLKTVTTLMVVLNTIEKHTMEVNRQLDRLNDLREAREVVEEEKSSLVLAF